MPKNDFGNEEDEASDEKGYGYDGDDGTRALGWKACLGWWWWVRGKGRWVGGVGGICARLGVIVLLD